MKQEKQKSNFSFRQQGETLELYIYDEIKSDKDKEFNWNTWKYDDPEVSAKKVRDMLDSNSNAKALDIYVNSNGGDVFEAYAMASMIKRFAGYKTCYIDGMAASAASLIPMVCDKVVMASYASILIHNMWTVACGNAKELRETADMLDDLMKSNRQLYLSRFNAGEEKLIELMDNETWLSADEAKAYGLVDEITSKKKEDQSSEDEDDDPLKEEGTDDDDVTEERIREALAGIIVSQKKASSFYARKDVPDAKDRMDFFKRFAEKI